MKRVSSYLKMRVLGAIEFAPGASIVERIRHVSEQPFVDEDGARFQFTWRTIQTWYSRYKKDGTTSVVGQVRSDKGRTRKVEPEQLLEAIAQVRGSFHGPLNFAAIYRACIDKNLLQRERVAPNTFRRIVKANELLKSDADTESKRRLAFAKAHVNQLWQADTMLGPHVQDGAGKVQSKLIAFIDDASRVCCHGEFFLAENTETLLKAFKSALYKRGLVESLYIDNGSIYSSQEISQVCQRIGCILCHTPVHDGAAKGKIERFFRTVRMSFLIVSLTCRASKRSIALSRRGWRTSITRMSTLRSACAPSTVLASTSGACASCPRATSTRSCFMSSRTARCSPNNTFSLKNTRFEAPRDLRNRKVQSRFEAQS